MKPIKERPILFSGPMVNAIREGRKTQTRRVIKPPWPDHFEVPYQRMDGTWVVVDNRPPDVHNTYPLRCPYGKPGDLLWVRESFRLRSGADTMSPKQISPDRVGPEPVWYADGSQSTEYGNQPPGKLRPSIFMPRWASRLTLRVTDVRVERVQEITEEDAIAEGVVPESLSIGPGVTAVFTDARDAFIELWDEINGPRGYGWQANPWVWVVTFEKVKR